METGKITYEHGMTQLEQIVSQIESGELDIDQLSVKLKEAKNLIAFCKKRLYEVDEEVKKLIETDNGE